MNVGARSISTGANYPSKAALIRAVKADPSDVLFYSTELFTTLEHSEIRASEIPSAMDTLYIVGPDPYTSRRYYGTAVNTAKGVKIT